MPFLWPPIEEEKYFPRKPENASPKLWRLGRVPTIFNHLSCAHILPLPYTFICATNEYIFFCCVAVVGGRFEILLVCEIFSLSRNPISIVFVFYSILPSRAAA